MESFQEEFFPSVYEAEQNMTSSSPYCTYDNLSFQFYTSSLFLSGLIAAPFGSIFTRNYGRRLSMFIGSTSFLIGAGLGAGAQNLAMLYVSRVMLGVGVGTTNSTVPIYLSETSPFRIRGTMTEGFHLMTMIGSMVAHLVNYGVKNWHQGWRLSLGLGAVPALVLLLGSIILPESPNSLIERGHLDKGRKVLEKLRGTASVDAEFLDIQEATKVSQSISQRQSWSKLRKRKYRPILLVSILVPLFNQLTGATAVSFYVPILFKALGTGTKGALLNAVIVGVVQVFATIVAMSISDKLGRRSLLIEGGVQMGVCMLIIAIVLGIEFDTYTGATLPSGAAIGILVVICVFLAGFNWSWGALGVLIPSEIQYLETRPSGMSVCISVNLFTTFILSQFFLSMLCAMKWGLFLFFGGWLVIMTLFVIFLLPETGNIPIEKVPILFAKHTAWRKIMGEKAAQEAAMSHEHTRPAERIQALPPKPTPYGSQDDSTHLDD